MALKMLVPPAKEASAALHFLLRPTEKSDWKHWDCHNSCGLGRVPSSFLLSSDWWTGALSEP